MEKAEHKAILIVTLDQLSSFIDLLNEVNLSSLELRSDNNFREHIENVELKDVDSIDLFYEIYDVLRYLNTPSGHDKEYVYELLRKLNLDSDAPDENFDSKILLIQQKTSSLQILVKAQNLILEQSNIFTTGKIITEVRPVFNPNDFEEIETSIIYHRFLLSYRNYLGKSLKTIELSLDKEDLFSLKITIDRALKKEELIRQKYQANQFNIIKS